MPKVNVVIPCYHLVWYNPPLCEFVNKAVVIPCYHLVWYNYNSHPSPAAEL